MFLKRAFYDPLFKCASKSTLFFTLFSILVYDMIRRLKILTGGLYAEKIKLFH